MASTSTSRDTLKLAPAPGETLGRKGRPRPGLRRFLLSLSPMTWACLDALIIGVGASGGQAVLVLSEMSYGWGANPWLANAAFCICTMMVGLVFGLYERTTLLSRSAIMLRTAITLGVGLVLAYACLSVFFYALASRWLGLFVAVTYIAVAVPVRLLAHEVVTNSRVRLLCIGAGESVHRLTNVLARVRRDHYDIIGHVRVPEGIERLQAARHSERPSLRFRSESELRFEESCPYLGQLGDLGDLLGEHNVDEIVVASEVSGNDAVGRAVAACLENRCRVIDQATFVEKLLGEVPAESITAEWFLRADVQNHGSYEAAKRLLDIVASGVGLMLTLPLWPLIMLAIRLESRGAPLYRQMRVGQNGRCFTMYKFRTMGVDAERDGARWAEKNDVRVTRVGRVLRRSRIDELPQLVNILRGDMSLVGPRPERPEFVNNLEQLLPHYRLRHLIKPGLSGWAQIHYGYGSSVADAHRKLCYDLYYLKHRSLDFDLAILIRTFGTFLLGAR